ncbi:VWA domain-containing protein [Flavobacteriales bacterium]|nr:VWA domain-containing protein [Flavobacteriales bacterium]
MNNYNFINPEFLYLLAIPLAYIIWLSLKKRNLSSEIIFSNTQSIKHTKTLKIKLRKLPIIIKLISCCLLIFALARPQSSTNWEESTTEGIDIVLSMDISGSMLAEDLKPNRLEASKDVAVDFISKRINDRIGLVIFSGESFTQCPLTTDHNVLINLFKDVKSGMVEDGTAIGMGLATAVNRLKDSKAISKVIILLTDGVNNKGVVAPFTAAEIAKKFGIRVYTIGVGTEGFAPYPFQTPFGIQYQDVEVQIDEKTLQDIASVTDGKYFRATNNSKLKEIYKDIDKLEKSKIEVTEFHKRSEEFLRFALPALFLLLFGFILETSYLKQIP